MFTYTMEKSSNKGYVWVVSGEDIKTEGLFQCTSEAELIEALKVYTKSAIIVDDEEDKDAMSEGERLAKKLSFDFIHP